VIRRLLWLFTGAALGAWATLRLKRLVRSLMPQSLAHQASGVGRTVRRFAGDVRVATDAREAQLRDALGLDTQADDVKAETDKDHH
jgi:chromosome condensin MukBEF MukE localization factor